MILTGISHFFVAVLYEKGLDNIGLYFTGYMALEKRALKAIQ